MNVSPYTFLFENEGRFFIFNSQSKFFSEIKKELYVMLYDRKTDLIPKEAVGLLKEKKIINDDKNPDLYFHHTLTQFFNESYGSKTMALIIAPTTGCNFECPYCFEPKKNPKSITPEVEDKIIEYINNRDHIESINLTWYGGEPLLMAEEIERIYDRICKETEKKIIHQEIITNAYLINDKVIDFFRRSKMDKIQISIDGVEETHDRTRYTKAGHKPTFRTIERNIDSLTTALPELNVSLRINIHKDNYKDFAILYSRYFKEKRNDRLSIYPGIIRVDSPDKRSFCHYCYHNDDLIELYECLERDGVNIDFMPRIHAKGCMIQRADAFIIGPEGELYKCWDDVSKPEKVVGSIMNDKLYNYDLLMRYMHECNPFDDECRKCSVFPICGGGCSLLRYRNKFENGEFPVCTPLKNPLTLKRVLLKHLKENHQEGRPVISML